MIEYMRKNANSTLVWLIIGAIAVVFIFFGVGGGGGGGFKSISVNGEEISFGEYQNAVAAISRNQPHDDNGSFSPAAEQRIRRMAIEELLRETLIRQFGENVGLEPSDEAIARHIASLPEFQTDGRFDRSRYEKELVLERTNSVYFEAGARRNMLNGRISALVTGLAKVQPAELKEIFHFQVDQASFDYVFFPAARHVAGLTPTDEALNSFYALRQEMWREPARMNIEYVELRPADFLEQVTVEDEELQQYYEENKQRFTRPESVEASQILIKFPSMNPSAEERRQTEEKAEAAYERSKTEDFADLAREISEDPLSAAAGGSMGPVTRGMTSPEFEEVAFAAPLNEVSKPVASAVGYHLIKVSQKNEAGFSPFEEVKERLENERKTAKARAMAMSKLEDLLVRAETNPKLKDAAESMGLSAKNSDYFTAADAPAFFGQDERELSKAFSAPLNKVAPPVEKDEYLVLYVPLDRQESRIPAFEEIRETVTEAWIQYESGRLAQAEAEAFIKKAGETNWQESGQTLAADGSAIFGKSEMKAMGELITQAPFDRVSAIDFMAAIYSVTRPGQVSPLAVPGENGGERGAFALAMSAFEPADEAELDGPRGQVESWQQNMGRMKQMYGVWLSALYDASKEKIHIPDEYLK